MNAEQRVIGNELDSYFNDYVKQRNGPSMGLNGIRLTANTNNSNQNWNGNEMNRNDNNVKVIMRPKKLQVVQEKRQQKLIRCRPQSTANSYASSIASSGMTDIKWRNSHASPCSSLSTSCQHIHDSSNMCKYEGYLDEEKTMINRGLENAKRLIAWYCERLKSVEKRSNLLKRGLVPVDGAVHEEKLNYLRAHIAELNRRITSLMESSDHSFPTHSNLQVKTQMPQPSDDQSQYYRRQNIKLCQELADKNHLIEQLRNETAEINKEYSSAFRKVQPKRLTSSSSSSATATTNAECNHYAQSHLWIPAEGTLM